MNKKLLNILTLGWAMICAGGPLIPELIESEQDLTQDGQIQDALNAVSSLYDMGFRATVAEVYDIRSSNLKDEIYDKCNAFLLFCKEILEAVEITAELPKDEFLDLLLDPDFKLKDMHDCRCACLLTESKEEMVVLTKVENQIVFLSLDENEEYFEITPLSCENIQDGISSGDLILKRSKEYSRSTLSEAIMSIIDILKKD